MTSRPAIFSRLKRRSLFRRWLVVIVPFGLFFGVPFIIYQVENFRGAREWRATQDRLVNANVRFDKADFVISKVPGLPENFAMTPLIRASWDHNWPEVNRNRERLEQCRLPDKEFMGDSQKLYKCFSKWSIGRFFNHQKLYQLLDGSDWLGELESGNSSEVLSQVIEQKFGSEFAELDQISSKASVSKFPVRNKKGESVGEHWLNQSLARLLWLRAGLALANGDNEIAIASVRSILFISECGSSDSALDMLSTRGVQNLQIFAIVWEGIEKGLWSDDDLTELADLLKYRGLLEAGVEGFEREMLLVLNIANSIDEISIFDDQASKNLWPWLPNGTLDFNRAYLCQHFYDQGIQPLQTREFHKIPELSIHLRVPTSLKESYQFSRFALLHEVFAHETRQYCLSIIRTDLYRSMARTSCAIERYKMSHHKLPASLDELVPLYLDTLPKDWFTPDHKPLSYLVDQEKGAYKLYSRGADLVDQGGQIVWHGHRRQLLEGDWVWAIPAERPAIELSR